MDSKSSTIRNDDLEKGTDLDFLSLFQTAESVANFAIKEEEHPRKTEYPNYQLFPTKDKFVWFGQSEIAILGRRKQAIEYDFKDQIKSSREKHASMKLLKKKHQCKKIRKKQIEMKIQYQEETAKLDAMALRIARDIRRTIHCAT